MAFWVAVWEKVRSTLSPKKALSGPIASAPSNTQRGTTQHVGIVRQCPRCPYAAVKVLLLTFEFVDLGLQEKSGYLVRLINIFVRLGYVVVSRDICLSDSANDAAKKVEDFLPA